MPRECLNQTTGLHVCIGSCAGNQRELRASRLKQREWHAEINSTCLCERAERHKYSIHSSTAHYFNVVTRSNRPPLRDAYQLCAYIRCQVSGSVRLNGCTNPDSLSRRNHTTGPSPELLSRAALWSESHPISVDLLIRLATHGRGSMQGVW